MMQLVTKIMGPHDMHREGTKGLEHECAGLLSLDGD